MEAEVKALCAKAREILVEESNVQRVDSPVTVSIKQLFWNTFKQASDVLKKQIYKKTLILL